MTIQNILYMQINVICILILIIIGRRLLKERSYDARRRRFLCVLVSAALICLSDIVQNLVEGSPELTALNYAFNVVYFVATVLCGYFWYRLCAKTLERDEGSTRRQLLFTIPALLGIVSSLLAPLTGWLFYIDAGGFYRRGFLFALHMMIQYFYQLVTVIYSAIALRRATHYSQRERNKSVLNYHAVPFLASLIQIIDYRIPCFACGITLATLLLFLGVQNAMVTKDELTGLNNRRAFFDYLDATVIAHPETGRDLHLLMMDVDRFKRINDLFGHTEGDRALILFAKALKSACRHTDFFIARYSGDEFLTVCHGTREELASFSERIQNELQKHCAEKPYTLSVSIGGADYRAGMPISDWIRLADMAMYEQKAMRQRNENKR